MTYRFGPFVADRTTFRVLRDDRALDLTPKLLDLLFYFLDRPAMLVTKESLLDDVWPDANVTDNALAQAISELREALGDRASEPTYIRTVARRGYRFVASVESAQPAAAASSAPSPAHAHGHATAHPPDGVSTIGVLDFTNVTGDRDIDWLASGIAETVTSDLAKLDGFRVVDRWRIVQAERAGAASAHEVGAALGLSRAVIGSYQRQGPNLRITARVLDLSSGTALADAKVDGPLAEAFALQDEIVSAFARELGASRTADGPRSGVRETASLDAYRAYTEGWLRVESLDTDLVPAAIKDFERAIALDPRYAMAHTGLANTLFVAYEMSRMTTAPNTRALDDGIDHARRAIRLDPRLAEAHATLSFLLVSAGQFDEARAAALAAVAIEPDSWRHQYRLGHASWGDARLRACGRALKIYPQFSYARFEMAMVFVARQDFDAAIDLARDGVEEQDRQAGAGNRFPAVGFHWLLGAIEAARGRTTHAMTEFDRELAQADGRLLYGPEYGALTEVGRGHGFLALGRPDAALDAFRQAFAHVPAFPRAVIGERLALTRLGRATASSPGGGVVPRPTSARGPSPSSLQLSACEQALFGTQDAALDALEQEFVHEPTSFLGWVTPIEPALASLRAHPRYERVVRGLAERAK
jgi:DNA-binding winged helix-turn-helix (wHTH) protein